MQVQLLSVGEENASKQLKMLQKVIRNLEVCVPCVYVCTFVCVSIAGLLGIHVYMCTQEEVMQERSKHQRYVNKKTEEMRALMQEVCMYSDTCIMLTDSYLVLLCSWESYDRLNGHCDRGLKI